MAARRGRHTQNGVRLFDPYRDLGQITELIGVAFGDRLDPASQISLAEMRRTARCGLLVWWRYWPGWSRAGIAPGFVWVEEGRVVGNVSLRRASGRGGFSVGNVAVHPDWQGRGIASGLMKAALEEISARGGRWVGLEVHADNQAAHRLYEHLGFRETGRTLCMLRPAGLPWAGSPLPHPLLRRGQRCDSAALIKLVRAIVPEPQRPLLELRRRDYQPGWERALDHWLEGRREVWWVVEEDGAVRGAVRALHERGRRPDRLEVLIAPEHSGRFEGVLVQRGMTSLRGAPVARPGFLRQAQDGLPDPAQKRGFGNPLRAILDLPSLRGAPRKMVETVLPSPTEPLVTALKAAGFQKLRVLVQMRLDMARHIPVKS